MIVAGIGCRKGVSADEVIAAVDDALARYETGRDRLHRLATSFEKAAEPGIAQAGARLGLPLAAMDADALRAASDRTITVSERSLAETGINSLSEAAALASAGPSGRLLGPRVIAGPVTCALADDGSGR